MYWVDSPCREGAIVHGLKADGARNPNDPFEYEVRSVNDQYS